MWLSLELDKANRGNQECEPQRDNRKPCDDSLFPAKQAICFAIIFADDGKFPRNDKPATDVDREQSTQGQEGVLNSQLNHKV
jgi:hypothetical protein